MPKISGVWLLNNILDFSEIGNHIESVPFDVYRYNFEGITYDGHCTSIKIADGSMYYYVQNATPIPPEDVFIVPNYLLVYISSGWHPYTDTYSSRKLDFGTTPIDVTEIFFNFITKNGRQLEGITSGFEIALFKNIAEPNRLDKTGFLTSVDSVYGVLRGNTSITNPVITIQYNKTIDFNYVYIPEFKRYYYITDITIVSNKLYDLSLSVDVLMSYKVSILKCKGFIDRSESLSNAYLVDNKRVIREGRHTDWNAVTNELFTDTSGWYVLNGLILSTHGGN